MAFYFSQTNQDEVPRKSTDFVNKKLSINQKATRISSISFDYEKSVSLTDVKKGGWIRFSSNLRRNLNEEHAFKLTNVAVFNDTKGIHSLRVSPKNEVALGFGNGAIKIIHALTDKCESVREPTAISERGVCQRVTSLRFVPLLEHILIAADCSGQIRMFNLNEDCCETIAKENNEINCVDVNYSGSKLLSAGRDAVLRLYDGETGQVLLRTPTYLERDYYCDPKKYHHLSIQCVKFDPENYNNFFSGGLDGYVKMWDIRDRLKSVRTFRGPYIRGDAIDLFQSTLLTGSWCTRKSIQLWDIRTGKLTDTLLPNNRAFSQNGDFLTTAKFFNGYPSGSIILVGGDGTNQLEIVSLKLRRIIGSFKANNSVSCIDSTPCNIVFGSLDNQCRFVHYRYSEEFDPNS